MSHFFTLVFITSGTMDSGPVAIVDHVTAVMRRYEAGRTVSDPVYWDHWRIGGRYDALLTRGPGPRNEADIADMMDTQLDRLVTRNLSQVRDLEDTMIPFAIMVPDGQCWIEGRMGSFGYSTDRDPYWEDRYDELRDAYAECWAVGVDAHR